MRKFLFGFILLLIVPGLLGAQQGKVFSVFDKGVSLDLELATITVTGAAIFEGTVTMNAAVTINNTVAVNDVITATVSDAATTTVTDVLKLIHNTSGTPDAGLGTGLQFQIEDLGGSEEQASIDVAFRTVTEGSEDADMIIKLNSGGGMAEVVRFVGIAGEERVGINGVDPVQVLAVKSEGDGDEVFTVIQDTSTSAIFIVGQGSGSQGYMILRGADHVTDILLSSDGNDSYINSGDFGIGVANPGAFVHIQPDSSSSLVRLFMIEDTTGQAANDVDTALVVMPDGNVGVGIASPTANLHVFQDSPTASQILFRIGTDGDATRFSVDEDGDVVMDGSVNVGAGGGTIFAGFGQISTILPVTDVDLNFQTLPL